MKPTQLDKIIHLCRDGEFHCQSELWQISHSPHKRRSDIEKEGIWKFEDRPCTHGITHSRDYKMILQVPPPKPVLSEYAINQLTLT